jgi:Fur family transcriptional regulator, ferric uptake regulator
MQAQAFSPDQTLNLLQQRGYRLTNPRRVIVETVLAFDHAFSAEDTVRKVDSVDPSVGRATVFRTLDVLTQLGVLDRLHSPDGCHSYVQGMGRDAHYHHLVCSSCGTVVPFEGCNIEDMLEELQRNTNFAISNHMLEVFGLCENCQN